MADLNYKKSLVRFIEIGLWTLSKKIFFETLAPFVPQFSPISFPSFFPSFDGEEEASCDALRALERLYSFL